MDLRILFNDSAKRRTVVFLLIQILLSTKLILYEFYKNNNKFTKKYWNNSPFWENLL